MRLSPVATEKIAVLRSTRELERLGAVSAGTRGAIVRAAAAPDPRPFSVMANIHSQKKRILRAERERLENRRYTSAVKTYFRRLESALESGDAETAAAEHLRLVKTIDKAVKTGALHRNTGARKKSRAARLLAGKASA
jgi:small subunit ribosomal protein S20